MHHDAPKEMETQKNNSITDLGKLLTGEKSRSSLTDKEIYDYLKKYHVPMKGDGLFKKLVTNFLKRHVCLFFSLLRWNDWKKTHGWYTGRNFSEICPSFVSCSMEKIRIQAYSLKEPFKVLVNLRRIESMPKQNITMKRLLWQLTSLYHLWIPGKTLTTTPEYKKGMTKMFMY